MQNQSSHRTMSSLQNTLFGTFFPNSFLKTLIQDTSLQTFTLWLLVFSKYVRLRFTVDWLHDRWFLPSLLRIVIHLHWFLSDPCYWWRPLLRVCTRPLNSPSIRCIVTQDIKRHKSDDKTNNTLIDVYDNETHHFRRIPQKDIKVGDIVKVYNP